MKWVSMLIKPVSANCNMRCKYCFYEDLSAHRHVSYYGKMSPETLENVVGKAMEAATIGCHFAFQGGEPTLAGLDFFQQFIKLEKSLNKKKLTISYSIQTNGYALDEEWAAFFAQNNFLVGISLDGNKEVHDRYRLNAEGKGSYSKIMRNIQLLKNYKVEFNILTVVTKATCQNIGKIYRFYKNNSLLYQQYIPCLDPIEKEPGKQDYSLNTKQYALFLKQLFDLWYSDFCKGEYVSIRYFDNLLQIIKGCPPESCNMTGKCSCQTVVEADGGVYPCDFYVLDRFRLGNLNQDSLQEIYDEFPKSDFIKSCPPVSKDCEECKWKSICRGGCRRDRDPLLQNVFSSTQYTNYLCQALQEFFPYCIDRLVQVAGKIHY